MKISNALANHCDPLAQLTLVISGLSMSNAIHDALMALMCAPERLIEVERMAGILVTLHRYTGMLADIRVFKMVLYH